jgi:hypothetical protein
MGRSPCAWTPLPSDIGALLGDPLIAERVQRRMSGAGVGEITTILEERLFGREPDVSQPVFDDGHQEREVLLAELEATGARLAASREAVRD